MLRERTRPLESLQPAVRAERSASQAVWERVPGMVSWFVVLSPVWLTLLSPPLGLAVVALAAIYFTLRASYFGPRSLLARRRVLREVERDWLAELRELEAVGAYDWRSDEVLDWRACRVTLLIRAYRERNVEMLRDTLDSIVASNWPATDGTLRSVEVLFATEVDDPVTPPIVDQLAQEYAGRLAIRQIRHPEEPGTLPGPSTAMNYVGRMLYLEALREGFSPRHWIVADFDADTLFHPRYLPCLVYHYVTDVHRDKRAYQPAVQFTTDYWKAPLHSRLSALGASTLTLGWLHKPEIAFTGTAASLDLLHRVDFWPTNSHSQDSGVEMRFRMRHGRDFRVIGLPVPLWVYPVMPMGEQSTRRHKLEAYWRSAKALFRQSARWREGPLDEFVEASVRGYPLLAIQKLLNGLERDTITLLPSYGLLLVIAVAGLVRAVDAQDEIALLKTIEWGAFSAVSLLGLAVFLTVLRTEVLMRVTASPGRIALELLLFWLTFSIYVPIFTSAAGLKTSTAYALGKRPRGHFMPTPK